MDKLNLPIPEELGLPTYAQHSLLFVREADGSYRMVVHPSAQKTGWRATSKVQGTLLEMRSGREYGVFS